MTETTRVNAAGEPIFRDGPLREYRKELVRAAIQMATTPWLQARRDRVPGSTLFI